jgi:hypothetical protein
MGVVSDLFDFEKFNFKDMWKKIKDNPARLLYGGIDPFSTALWNGILGRKDEPLVNQLGGPAGGGKLGFDKSGGVFGRAQGAGIDTSAAAGLHSGAEVVASAFGGAGIGNALGGGSAATAGGAAGTDIGGAGSIIGGQFVPAGGFVSDAALASLGGAGGAGAAGGTVASGLGGSSAFLGGGGLSTSGVSANALNADILAGGSGSIGGVGGNGSSLSVQAGDGSGFDFSQIQNNLPQQQGGGNQTDLLELIIEMQRQAEEQRRASEENERRRQAQFGMLL